MSNRVRQVFTNRHGGVSSAPYSSFNLGDHVGDRAQDVHANRQRLASLFSMNLDQLFFMEQIHSPTVTEVHAGTTPGIPVPATDALITTMPYTALVVLTADCVPVLLADEEAGVIAAVHAGRLGARNGIVAKTVQRMEELGAHPQSIHALMGAAASGEAYEVPADMAEDVERKLPGSRVSTVTGTPGLDLRAGIEKQLKKIGVQNVDIDPRCTISDPDFFSYRREGVTGRQASMIWMEN